jgi:aryl-alcohol dehydrogenase-like predicted oxidoreductase
MSTGCGEVPFILGGHSFIAQLGNDPPASREEQIRIVEACLDSGIRWFDTTHLPERRALGEALDVLGRRDEATIIAWNFFKDVGPEDRLDRPLPYDPRHIGEMLDQLRTDFIDCLVVHSVENEVDDERQQDLAVSWRDEGLVDRLGTWSPGLDARERYGEENPYDFMVRPFNVNTEDATPVFALSKSLGWDNFACSPFVRGWKLDSLVERAANMYPDSIDPGSKVADLMLRYSMFQPDVDRLIVAMRRSKWVSINSESYRRGPLRDEEADWLASLVTADKK